MKKAHIFILLFISFSLLFIESKPNSNLKKISKKNPEKEPIQPPFPEEKEHPKEYYDELVEKGLRLDNLTKGHAPYDFYKKINYTEDKRKRREYLKSFKKKENRRRLSTDQQTLENLGFMGLVQDKDSTQAHRVMRFVVNNIRKDDSRFVLYPYFFEYLNKTSPTQEMIKVNEGGVFTLNQTALKGQTFKYLQNISSVQISKAKGIYDIDIAILSMEYTLRGMDTDLFTEASDFCNYFVNTISKTSACLEGKNGYLEYKQKYPTKGAVVRISAKDVLNKTLYDPDTNQLKFKLLIIPDYLSNNEETIFSKNYLNSTAIDVIKKFVDLGGNIITSGKSGYLLELMNIIPSGTYDNTFLLQTSANKGENTIDGCAALFKEKPEDQTDFFKQLLCLGYKNRTVLTQTFKVNKVPDNFESLIKYTNREKKLNYKQDGRPYDIDDKDATFDYILVSKEEGNKGRIFLVNGNPIGNSYYFENVRNMILYSMSRDFIYDLNIKFTSNTGEEADDDLPIPAGEEGVQLSVSYKFYNLFDYVMNNFKLEILFANKIELVSAPTGCELKKEKAQNYDEANLADFNLSQYLLCEATTVNNLQSIGNKFKIEITNYTVTARLIDIPLMHSRFSLKKGEQEITVTPGIFYAQAAVAALLRGTLNKDPTSSYPMEGCGLYFDLVLTVENKENTLAKDVNYIALIPLVTPLVDGEDEGLVAQVVPVYEDYYFKHEFTYPWKQIENREIDYIDYAEVAGKNICYVNDYDTPVKLSKNQRTDEEVDYNEKYVLPDGEIVLDEKMGSAKGISKNTLLRQLYFVDAERFYETAAPRLSLFVDQSTEKGAQCYYGDVTKNIPEDEKDLDNSELGRIHLAFIRVDTYFYTSIFNQYQLPNGFDGKILISIDKFDQSDTTKAPILDKQLGEIKSKVYNKGHYDSTKGKFNTLKPNEYTNPFRQYKSMTQYDPTKPEDLKKLQNLTTDKVNLTHFMSPNKNPRIKRAGNVYGFVEESGDEEGNGHLEEYPSVKFVYAHSVELTLPPEITRLGGYAEIILPSGVTFRDDPVKNDRITTSADNVAFYKNEYDAENNVVKLYFRRGLMPNENYGLPSKCEAYLENLSQRSNFTINLKIYELKYDFSSETLESYYLIESATKDLTAAYRSFFSFPCLYLENTVKRQSTFAEEPSHDMYEYELMNPFARYGGYFQELTKHTTVFGSAEAHHVKDPGFQGVSAGFSIISNIGTSSIPFAEFLNHGTLAIPGVTSTSRLEWTDIWGRKWAQNLRSVYPDIPPIPPAPLNFIMTTTFELITNDNKQERVIEWQSDESVYIRVQMKMRNTYKLYWEPTLCLANQRPHIKESCGDNRNPIFIEEETQTVNKSIGSDHDVNLGFSAVYGVCYDENSYMNGTKITPEIKKHMQSMMTCAESLDPVKLTNCSKWAVEMGLPIVKKRPDTVDDEKDPTPKDNWNYSPLIEAYLPDGYINSNQMWQLTIEDYSDDQFWKGYPWHLDDCIPNLDNSINKPHDIIAFPIYKGLGYSITYDRQYSLKKFPEYKGWWSDQLQSKDHTLLAGQQKVSQVSVGHDFLIKDEDWIDGYKLKGNNLAKNRMKNLYVCLFNRHRVKVTPGQSKFAWLGNVYQNNVVPIIPDLKENDSRYTNYPCEENGQQYSIYDISQVDNRVYTGNDRDWLYFAAGLRSNAMEDINVILKLDPMDSTKFEGITKVQDGGRFTYWQPPDGPNSYQYYDGNVNTVIGKRVDITISGNAIPLTINTFNTYLYELFQISDDKEYNREYTLTTYMNSHGYGDATTTVYVGGVDATTCRVEPDTFTYVKIVFYNNAGFDWTMKEGAITLENSSYSDIFLNAANIMKGKMTAVQYPSEYKFMSYEIPEEIKPYVTLTPSQHVMDVSPQFFDLTFNNILNIKDALEGDYFYCLNVSKNFPENLKGKLWEIKMTLNEEWFETLPSLNDPTGIHDYHLTIPSIRFGVPISEGEYKGKIFYNLGQAKNLVYTYRLYKEFEIKGIKLVNDDIISELGEASGKKIEKYEELLKIWNKIPENKEITDKIIITNVTDKDTFYNLHTINLTEAFPLFPYEEAANKPYVSKISLLVQSYSIHSPYGHKNLMTSTNIKYNDGRKNKRHYASPSYINIYSEGPHFNPTFEHKIAEFNETTFEYQVSKNQEIYDGDYIIIRLTLIAANEGTANAYYPHFEIKVNKDAQYIETNQTTSSLQITEGEVEGDEKAIKIFYQGQINANDETKFDLYFKVQFGNDLTLKTNTTRRRNLASNNKVSLVKELNMDLCITNSQCQEGDQNYGKQISDLQYSISYKTNTYREVGKISLEAKNIGSETYPIYNLSATVSDIDSKYSDKEIVYIFYRMIEGIDTDYKVIARSTLPTFTDEPFADSDVKEIKKYKVNYKVIGQYTDGRTLDSKAEGENQFEDSYAEAEKKNKSFPAYAIALIVVLGLALIAGAAFLAYKLLAKKAVEASTMAVVENPEIVKNYAGEDSEKIPPTSPRKKRRIQNRSVITVEENHANP